MVLAARAKCAGHVPKSRRKQFSKMSFPHIKFTQKGLSSFHSGLLVEDFTKELLVRGQDAKLNLEIEATSICGLDPNETATRENKVSSSGGRSKRYLNHTCNPFILLASNNAFLDDTYLHNKGT